MAPSPIHRRFFALIRRALRGAAAPFRFLGRRFLYAPRSLQIVVILVLAAGGMAGGIFAYDFHGRHTAAIETTIGYREFEAALRKGDLPAMKAAMDRVLAIRPDDAVAARKRDDLEREEADPDDPDLARVLVNHHMKANRLQEMAREARKVRARFPNDWRATCVLAHYAWDREGPAAALAELENLPNPEDASANVDIGGLLYSLHLFEQTGRDASSLRGLIVRRLLPALRGGAAAGASPVTKLQLVECYLEPFQDANNREVLGNYWVDAARLTELAVEGARDDGDVPTLVRLGNLGPRMLVALAGLRTRQNMTDERYALLRQEIDDRTRKVWEFVREKEPGRVESYRGLAQLAWESRDAAAIDRTLRDGLRACGERVELLAQMAQLWVNVGRAAEASEQVWAAATRTPGDVNKWVLAAEVALAAGRRDRVFEACQNARRLAPDHPLATLIEADWYLEQGEPEKVLHLLGAEAFQARRVRDPDFAVRQARALAAMGSLPDDLLNGITLTAAAEKRSPVPTKFAALLGLSLVQPPRPERDALIAREARELVLQEPDGPHAVKAQQLAAQSLARRAECLSPPWPKDAVHAALQAFEVLPAEAKASVPVRIAIAHLQLQGLNDPSLAARTAAPLLDDRTNPRLTPAQLEVLGLILVRTRRADEAVPLLESAVARPHAPAGCWIALALARHALHQAGPARAALDYPMSQSLKLSPREHAEWTAAALALKQESP